MVATDRGISHGRDITRTRLAEQAAEHGREAWIGNSWIMERTAPGLRDGKPFQAADLAWFSSTRLAGDAALSRQLRRPAAISA